MKCKGPVSDYLLAKQDDFVNIYILLRTTFKPVILSPDSTRFKEKKKEILTTFGMAI